MFGLITKRKIIFLSLLLVIFLGLSTKTARAFSTPNSTYQFQFEQAVTSEEMNLQSYVYETMKATAGSVVMTITGCFSCSGEERRANPGLVMTVGNLIVGAYANPPASGVQYLAYLKNKIGLATPVYAQEEGLGFQAMNQIMPIWRIFRNISYSFLIIILVFLGLAIMFRVKISPQAVMTIQSALPRVVIALILITFSYAIVGFLIDLMFLLYVLMLKIFATLPLYGDNWTIGTLINWINNHILGLFGRQLSLGAQAVITGFFAFFIVPLMALLFLLFLNPLGWILVVPLAVIILITVFRCVFTLLKAYAMIIVHLIFAPFEILVGVLPGSNATGAWFKNLLANVAVLPAMMTMFFLASYLIFMGLKGIGRELVELLVTGWLPGHEHIWDRIQSLIQGGFLGVYATYWQFISAIIFPLIGVMIFFMAPKVADIIQSFITGKPFGYGTAIGEAIGAPGRAVGWGIRGIGTGLDIEKKWRERRVGMPSGAERAGKVVSYPGEPENLPSF